MIAIRDLLARTVPSTDPVFLAGDPDQRYEALRDGARERVRAALKERDEAALALEEARASAARVRELILEADIAESALHEAEAGSAAFTRAWAEGGARADVPSIDPALRAAADTAAAAAISARIAADGASGALAAIMEAESNAENRLKSAAFTLREARAAELAAMVEPHLEAAAAASADLASAIQEVEALARVLLGDPARNGTATELLARLRALVPAPPRLPQQLVDPDQCADLRERVEQWAQSAAALAAEILQ